MSCDNVSPMLLACLTGLLMSSTAAAQSTFLELPVHGNWMVVQGPPCAQGMGGHCATVSQQFALDLAPYDQATGLIANCIGAPIYSPITGTVIEALDGFPNQPTGVKWGQHIAGNHVVIQKSASEFVLLAHFSPNTVSVKVGQQVKVGDQIATCGNTGNSDFPHLHIHMQATPQILNIMGSAGLPMNFASFQYRTNPLSSCVVETGKSLFRNVHLC